VAKEADEALVARPNILKRDERDGAIAPAAPLRRPRMRISWIIPISTSKAASRRIAIVEGGDRQAA